MAGKRASMREGPLAALFRKTETEGLEDAPGTSVVEESHAPQEEGARPRPSRTRRACPPRRSGCATRSPPTCPRT